MYRAVEKEISKYKSNLMAVQEVRRGRGSTESAGEYTLFYGKRNENHELRTGFSYIRKSNQQLGE
jgi:hypothetical protein